MGEGHGNYRKVPGVPSGISTRTQWVSGKDARLGLKALWTPSRAPSSYLLFFPLLRLFVFLLQPLALSTTPASSRKPSSQQLLASRCEDSQPQLKSFGSDSKFSAQIRDWLSVDQVTPLGRITWLNPRWCTCGPMMMGNSFLQGDNTGQRERPSSLPALVSPLVRPRTLTPPPTQQKQSRWALLSSQLG